MPTDPIRSAASSAPGTAGRTWSRVLFRGENTGAIDLALDPHDSRTILAALWQTRRPPWNVYPPSNGPGSGLFRSTDGGDTWSPVTEGLPSEKLGRIRIAFAPSMRGRVYALVDAKAGGLYVSDDAGVRWRLASGDRRIWERGWYFAGVTVDPNNADVVYACDTALYKSTDAGRTFEPFKGAPGGDDYHQLWIDPVDSRRMILGSDQGAVVSVDGGRTWSSWYNQPTAQFYHVATDDRFPYWIYGAQQDSGAAATPSRTDYRDLSQRDWRPIAVGGENGYIAPDPGDPDIVFGGGVGRFDWRTLQEQDVDPTLAYPGDDYRSEWTLPLAFSPANPRALYYGNQFLFRTTNAGRHWEKVSPDLTREAPGVPATIDAVTAEDSAVKGPRRGVIYAIAPSSLREELVWCGTDDGLIWLTRDGGKHWVNVTPPDLTAWSKIGVIESSHFDPEAAFVAIDRHRLDDLRPYVLRTRDGGKTWTSIARGIPDGSYVNVVREDPERRGLLYAGTETGVFVSFDEGEHWQSLQANMPNCSVRDLSVRHGDLVAATHGRSFWVLDDLTPLRQLDARVAAAPVWLFEPRTAIRLNPAPFQGTPDPKDEPGAANPPRGAILDYGLKTASPSPVVLEILDARGELVRRYASDDKVEAPDLQRIQVTPDWVDVAEAPSAAAGMHRFVWDLRYAAPKELPRSRRQEPVRGVWAPPGRYEVRLVANGQAITRSLVVSKDPRIPSTEADLRQQFDLAKQVEAERVRLASALTQARDLRERVTALRAGATGAVREAVDAFTRGLDLAAGPPIGSDEQFEEAEAERTNLRRLSSEMARFQRVVESADVAPTPDALAGFERRREDVSRGLSRWKDFLDAELPVLNRALEAAGLPRQECCH